jgi:hypothetical protein
VQKNKNSKRLKMAKTKTWDKTVFTILVTVALGLPIIEPNVIPLEAAFQGKMS